MDTVRVVIDAAEIERQARMVFDDVAKAAAEELYNDLKRPNAYFKDETGELRDSIHIYKSYFEDGGYVVTVEHPQAFYIEHGHAKVVYGNVIEDFVPGLFFLRRAAKRMNRKLGRIITSHTRGLHIGRRTQEW